MADTNIYQKKAFKHILWLALITGTLNAIATLLLNYKVKPEIIFRFIAGGVFDKGAFVGGTEMIVAGVVFHYLIAYVFTAAFYLLFPFFISVFKNKYIVGILYGLIAWLIMNLGVVPASKIGFHPITINNILIGMAALIICIGLPVAIIANSHLTKYNK